ncbi:hypothetical protein [Burkholderia pyrrocinia]|uniref:hypothetical protein n=1 Tax=Burkholderia pyrrocinia TaxID=60550 RepID=UPI00158AA40A|nr:hypothetical protein [Burkholderia pyrrocinia]
MKTPVNETLVMDVAGHVAVVVTDVAAVFEALVRLGFARHPDRCSGLMTMRYSGSCSMRASWFVKPSCAMC